MGRDRPEVGRAGPPGPLVFLAVDGARRPRLSWCHTQLCGWASWGFLMISFSLQERDLSGDGPGYGFLCSRPSTLCLKSGAQESFSAELSGENPLSFPPPCGAIARFRVGDGGTRSWEHMRSQAPCLPPAPPVKWGHHFCSRCLQAVMGGRLLGRLDPPRSSEWQGCLLSGRQVGTRRICVCIALWGAALPLTLGVPVLWLTGPSF